MAGVEGDRLCVAVYTPMIGGMYYSELVLQIVQLCEIKRHKVKLIETGGNGTYKSNIGLAGVDIVILLRNSVDVGWVKSVRASGKAVVSVSYDYFPLDVPFVVSDHAYGVKLAYEELERAGCKKVAFVGNLNNYDVRKRYESFCEYLDAKRLSVNEEDVYSVKEDILGGGREAAEAFIKQDSDADGIVFGTTMNAVGFCNHLHDSGCLKAGDITAVSFDANSMVPVLLSNMCTVDQNLNLIAHKAVSIGEAIVNGGDIEKRYTVQPKIIMKDSEDFGSAEAYMATSCEAQELSDPNYMKCTTYNFHEWSELIAQSNLDEVMILRPLFNRDLQKVTFGRFVNAGSGNKFFKVIKAILPTEVINYSPQDKASLCREEGYPDANLEGGDSQYDKALHIMVDRGGEHWGVLSVYGSYGERKKSSFLILVMYLKAIMNSVNAKGLVKPVGNAAGHGGGRKPDVVQQVKGTILWNVSTNASVWDAEALSILGFESDLDKGVYMNMDLVDRILDSEVSMLRACMAEVKGAFTLNIHYKHKDRSYLACELYSDGVERSDVVELNLRTV